MTTTGQTFQIHSQVGGLVPGRLVRVTRPPVPDWLIVASTPYSGQMPAGDVGVHLVDGHQAAIDEAAIEAALVQPAKTGLRLADVKTRFGWRHDDQATHAIGMLGFPKGRIMSSTSGILGQREHDRWQQWSEGEIAEWEAAVRFVFPSALGNRTPRT